MTVTTVAEMKVTDNALLMNSDILKAFNVCFISALDCEYILCYCQGAINRFSANYLYIMTIAAVSFISGGNRSTCNKLTNFIT